MNRMYSDQKFNISPYFRLGNTHQSSKLREIITTMSLVTKLKEKVSANFVSNRDGPVKSTETRQG